MDGQGERDEASWAVDGYLPMANAMATLRGFPIVLVATNHEDASLPNVEAGGSVAEVRECQRHGRADRQFGVGTEWLGSRGKIVARASGVGRQRCPGTELELIGGRCWVRG